MFWKNKKRIYLDYASATPFSKGALGSFIEGEKHFANSFSIHSDGVSSLQLIQKAKNDIASVLRAREDEIFFVSSGTESDNLAIYGSVIRAKKDHGLVHVVTTSIEHEAVLGVCKRLEKEGVEVTYVDPDENGFVDPKKIRDAIKKNTVLVSVMYVNNELGTIQSIKEISKNIRHFKKNNKERFKDERSNTLYPLFHTDACQATNLLSLDIPTLGVDLLSLNGAKCYAGKGTALLYVRKGVSLESMIFSKNEKDITPGTKSVGLINALSFAIVESQKIKEKEYSRLSELKNFVLDKIKNDPVLKERLVVTVQVENVLPSHLHFLVKGIGGELCVIELDVRGISVSSQSACRSDSDEDSYVVKSLGREMPDDYGTLRVSLGRFTSKSDCKTFVEKIRQVVKKYPI